MTNCSNRSSHKSAFCCYGREVSPQPTRSSSTTRATLAGAALGGVVSVMKGNRKEQIAKDVLIAGGTAAVEHGIESGIERYAIKKEPVSLPSLKNTFTSARELPGQVIGKTKESLASTWSSIKAVGTSFRTGIGNLNLGSSIGHFTDGIKESGRTFVAQAKSIKPAAFAKNISKGLLKTGPAAVITSVLVEGASNAGKYSRGEISQGDYVGGMVSEAVVGVPVGVVSAGTAVTVGVLLSPLELIPGVGTALHLGGTAAASVGAGYITDKAIRWTGVDTLIKRGVKGLYGE